MKNILKNLSMVATALPLVLASAASYATTSFATFSDKTDSQFVFSNNGTNASFTSIADPVNFNFTIAGLDAALQGVQNAHLNYSVSTTAQAINVGFLGLDIQPMNSVTTLSIVRDTAYNSFTNLLTVTFSGGTLSNQLLFISGGVGSNGLSESAGTGSGQNVTFTSDFLNFSGASSDVGLTFTGLSSPVAINSDNFLNSFTATGAGTFSADPSVLAVPEPETYAMLLTGLGLMGFITRRKSPKKAA